MHRRLCVCACMCLYFPMQKRGERENELYVLYLKSTFPFHHLCANIRACCSQCMIQKYIFVYFVLCCKKQSIVYSNFTLTWYYHLAWFQNWISPHFTKESDIGFGHHHAWVFKLRWDHRMDTYIKYDLPDYCLKYKISVTLRVSSPVSLRSQLNAHSVSLLFHFTLNSRLFVSNSLLEIKSTSNYYCRGIHTLYSKNN